MFTNDEALCLNNGGACGNEVSFSFGAKMNACPDGNVPLRVDRRLVVCGVEGSRRNRQVDVCCVDAAANCVSNGGTCQDGAAFAGLDMREMFEEARDTCADEGQIPTSPYRCSDTQACCVDPASICGDKGGTCTDGADFTGDLDYRQIMEAAKDTCSGASLVPSYPFRCGDTQACCVDPATICEEKGGTCQDGADFSGVLSRPEFYQQARSTCSDAGQVPSFPLKCSDTQACCRERRFGRG